MQKREVSFLLHCRFRQYLAGVKIMAYVSEYPGFAKGSPAYHDAVNPVPVKHFPGSQGSVHVAVTYDGNLHPGVVLYFANERPVGFPTVHLRPGTPMNCQPCNACILKSLCKVNYCLAALIPSQ